jgi:hypothetical protein
LNSSNIPTIFMIFVNFGPFIADGVGLIDGDLFFR